MDHKVVRLCDTAVTPAKRHLRMTENATYFVGQLLVAMPGMRDPRFNRAVIYMCAHSDEGALGLVINQLVDHIDFPNLLEQLDIETETAERQIRVHFGGPVETGRGFVLHSADYTQESTLRVNDQVGLTASVGILEAIAQGSPTPRHSLLALGYAGWGPGQLDDEVQANAWLQVPPDDAIIFDDELHTKWGRAVEALGIDVSFLSGQAGHA
jgi:putative transcriptional regulator